MGDTTLCNVGVQLLFGVQPSTMRIAGHRLVEGDGHWLVAVDAQGIRYLVSAGTSRDWILYPLLDGGGFDENGAVHVQK